MAGKQFGISVVIGGVDKISKVIGRVQQSIAKFHNNIAKRFNAISQKMGFPQMAKAVGGVRDGLAGLAGRLTVVGGLIGGVAAVATSGLWGIVNSVGAAGSALFDLSKQTGINAESIQEWRYAADQNGVAAEEFDKSLQALTRNLGKAAQGKGAAKLFEGLGIKLKKANREVRSTEELMPEIADKLAAIRDPSIRAAAASELFGKAGIKLVPMLADGSKGLEAYAEDARRLGFVLSKEAVAASKKFGDRMTDLNRAISGAKNTIGAELLPAITQLVDKFTAFVVENQPKVKAFFAKFAQDLPGRIETAITAFNEIKDAVKPVVDSFGWLSDKIGAGNTAMLAIGGGIMIFLVPALAATTAAFVALGTAMLTTPVGWILGAIAMIAGAAHLIYSNWEPITEFFGTWWQFVKDAFSAGVEFIAGIWEDIKEGFKGGFLEGLINLWETLNPINLIVRAFTELVPKLRKAVGPLKNLLPQWAQKLMGGSTSIEVGDAAREASSSNPFGPPVLGSPPAASAGPMMAAGTKSETNVTVDFQNVPKGTRTQADSRGPASFELNMGFGR